MSKAKAKKLIPPIVLENQDDLGLKFILKTQIALYPPSHLDFIYKVWGIEKTGKDQWHFKTVQNEAWAISDKGRAKICFANGSQLNYLYLWNGRRFVRKDMDIRNGDRKFDYIHVDYSVGDLIDEVTELIKARGNDYYRSMLRRVNDLAKGTTFFGHTKPIAVDAHGYLRLSDKI